MFFPQSCISVSGMNHSHLEELQAFRTMKKIQRKEKIHHQQHTYTQTKELFGERRKKKRLWQEEIFEERKTK